VLKVCRTGASDTAEGKECNKLYLMRHCESNGCPKDNVKALTFTLHPSLVWKQRIATSTSVWLSLRSIISETTHSNFTKFSAHDACGYDLSPPLAHCIMICTSSTSLDDVVLFSYYRSSGTAAAATCYYGSTTAASCTS